MSEERLEEIKSRVWKDKGTYAMGDENQREGYIYTLSDYDYKWLIEQAEQVSALETTIDFYQSALRDADRRVQGLEKGLGALIKQNKRYHEALENIVNSDWWLIKPNPFCTIEEVYEYCVVEAQKAIKGEE